MIGTAATMYAYAKAPRTTFAVKHPRTAAKLWAYSRAPRTTVALRHPRFAARAFKARWDLRNAYAPRITAVGAAAIALPLGLALGRHLGCTPEEVE